MSCSRDAIPNHVLNQTVSDVPTGQGGIENYFSAANALYYPGNGFYLFCSCGDSPLFATIKEKYIGVKAIHSKDLYLKTYARQSEILAINLRNSEFHHTHQY